MGNSGGAATNSGIDFQQRIAALVLAHILADVKDYTTLQLGYGLDVKEVRFETNDSIDDLVIVSTHGRTLVQAKRSLSLSESSDSEYSSVLKQFVAQYVDDNISTDSYVLATSSRASQRITKELRKLTEAARLNETSGCDNPITKAEKDVLEKTRGLIQAHYVAKTGSLMSEDDFSNLFKRIRVAQLDIEEGAPLEMAVLILLAGKASVSPELVWGSLISLCVSLAKDRLSIDRAGLLNRMGKFIGSHSSQTATDAVNEFLRLQCQGSLSSGREVLLIKSFMPDADYMILELYRFQDDGRKRLKFFDGKAELMNEEIWDVIHRTSTFAGMERYIENNVDQFSDARVVIIPIDTQANIDDEPYAKAHAENCSHQAEASENPFMCLHCGDAISEDSAPFIEIDEEFKEHCLGLVHSKCLGPIDRVLGVIDAEIFRENKLLKNFDYSQWFLGAPRGQGLFGTTANINNRVISILWKPDYNQVSKGGWCIKINLEDGSARYVHERGRVMRYAETGACSVASHFNVQFEKARSDNDPWCYTSENEGFGTYSSALQIMTADETCILCVKAESVPYTRSIGNLYSRFDNFYAPLAILLEQDSGLPFSIGGAIFLISNPLRLEKYVDNWRRAGIDLPEFVVSTIESDDKFDKFVQQVKDNGGGIIVDPILNFTGELSSGVIIENHYDFVKL